MGGITVQQKESVKEQLEKKFDVLLNIDVKGAAELKKLKQSDDLFTNFLYTIFIAPKSINDLRKRLINRGQRFYCRNREKTSDCDK